MKNYSLSKITIKNAQYYAYHGVRKEEQKLGGKYEVDLELWYDAKPAFIKDDVNFALNYEEAMFCISEVILNEQYNLLETIANEILSQAMEKFEILKKASVRVRKHSVPLRRAVDYVEVEQYISRLDSDKIEE
ncbi:MAG: dihydroneopterin aldolase [Candidatus Kapaibacteriales bacterium]